MARCYSDNGGAACVRKQQELLQIECITVIKQMNGWDVQINYAGLLYALARVIHQKENPPEETK